MQIPSAKICIIDGCDLDLPTCGRLDVFRNLHHVVIVKVKSRHRVIGLRMLRLFLDGQRLAVLIEFHDAVLSRVSDIIAEDRRTVFLFRALRRTL